MNSYGFRFIIITVLFCVCAGKCEPIAWDLVSSRDDAIPKSTTGSGDSFSPSITSDGRFVVFASNAGNLVTNANPWLHSQVYLRDRANKTTTLVSENLQQVGANYDVSSGCNLSSNGQVVVWESAASDLVANDTNGVNDVFIRVAGLTTLISVGTNGYAGNKASRDATMTPDGRFIAFISDATNLVPGDINGGADIFVRDTQMLTTSLVSAGATNAIALWGAPVITPDGRWVAYFSSARGMLSGISNFSEGEIYLRDMTSNVTYWPSTNVVAQMYVAMAGSSVGVPFHPQVSDDGRYVAFGCGWSNNFATPPLGTVPAAWIFEYDRLTGLTTQIDTNAYPPDIVDSTACGPVMTPDGRYVVYAGRVTNGVSVFRCLRYWDRDTGSNILVSLDLAGVAINIFTSISPAISPDGRYVTFVSDATNLVSGVVTNIPHVYRRDMVAQMTELVDKDFAGIASATGVLDTQPQLSADGRYIAYASPGGDLVAGDGNNVDDVFVRDLAGETNELISVRAPEAVSHSANLSIGMISVSDDGNRVAFATQASDIFSGDTNQLSDVFVFDRRSGTNFLVSVGTDGAAARGGSSIRPQLSGDGQHVLFVSGATNLVTPFAPASSGVYLRDLSSQTTTRVSVTTNGADLGSAGNLMASMSPDARYCVLVTATNSAQKLTYYALWRDMAGGATRLISASAHLSTPPSISTNGQRVAYFDSASRLLVWDAGVKTNTYTNATATSSAFISPGGNRVVFRSGNTVSCYDLSTKTMLTTWSTLENFRGASPWSADERYIAFVSPFPLVAGDTDGTNDVYFCDLQSNAITLVSKHRNGGTNFTSDAPMFSRDGRFIVYRSHASDIVSDATNSPGILLYEMGTGSNRMVAGGSPYPIPCGFSRPVISGNGNVVAFASPDAGLVPDDLNQLNDAFAGDIRVLDTTDSDGDNIPDWWMQRYFGHATGQVGDLSRADDDADGDGLSNLLEFFAGTDPTDAQSGLAVQITTTPLPGTDVLLRWLAEAGRAYHVQYRDDLAGGDWQDLPAIINVVGRQGSATVQRTNDTRMFRVRCDP